MVVARGGLTGGLQVIQTATESAHVSQDARSVAADATAHGKKSDGKGGLGLFARILAGLHGRHGTDAAGETDGAESSAGNGGLKTARGGNGSRATKAASATHAEVAASEKNTKHAEGEPSQTGLSEHEKNILDNLSALAASLPEDPSGQTTVVPETALDSPDGEDGNSGVPIADSKPESGKVPAAGTAHRQAKEVPTETVQGEASNAATADGSTSAVGEAAGVLTAESSEKPRKSGDRPTLGQADGSGSRETLAGGLDGQVQPSVVFANSGNGTGREELGARDRRRNLVAEARELRAGGATRGENAALVNLGDPVGRTEVVGKDMVVEVRMPTHNGTSSATTAWDNRQVQTPQAMENMLTRELQQHLNGDIVRQASLILRDGSEGTIRLALKPESLGNVKIHLEMAENKITGFIVVESEDAMRAFEREIDSIRKEFMDAGFDGAELQMSLADGGSGQGGETEDGAFTPRAFAASRYDASAEMTETSPSVAVFLEGTGAVDVHA
jgi:flagellar hook-length control protein FliK